MGIRSWARNEWTEAKEAGREIASFVRNHDWKKSARQSVRRKYWVWWLATIVLTVAVVLLSVYRDTIIEKFEPHKQEIVDLPVSWLIPIAVLVILSFPPLGGHEIVLMVVGLIWGVWIGFGIACAGTYIGEVLCFWGFKYFFTNKANEIESKNIFYACIARLMRHGGVGIIIIVRFSAVPGHVVTAIQSTVGMSLWVYSLAIIVSLPKQLAVVYLGYMFGVNHETASPDQVRRQKIISLSVLFATGVATVLSLYIVYMRARKLYPEVLRDMEEAQVTQSPLAAAAAASGGPRRSSSSRGPQDGYGYGSGPGRGGAPLARRQSLVEAAFEGEPGAPESSWTAQQNRSERGRTARGGGNPAWGDADAEGDEWDAKSPAMRRGAAARGEDEDDGDDKGFDRNGAPRYAWHDGRTPTLGYDAAPPTAAPPAAAAVADAAPRYAPLPLSSESEVGVTAPSPAGGCTGGNGPAPRSRAGAAATAPGPYEDPLTGTASRDPRGQYGAMGRSR